MTTMVLFSCILLLPICVDFFILVVKTFKYTDDVISWAKDL
jgi:hypothetical protein